MPATPDADPFDALDPVARRATPRVRIAVGAAVVLFIAAVAVAAVLSSAASGGGAQGTIVADRAAPRRRSATARAPTTWRAARRAS